MNKIIEENRRFSESMLWELQRRAYMEFGPDAWADKGVPSYLTSNPFTVKQYIKVAHGFLRDSIRNKIIDRKAPLYIFDLGAGSGRFGYLFLRQFLELVRHLYGNALQVRYIMTDIVEVNLTFLKEHPFLRPYIDQGILDFAMFAHDRRDPMKLMVSGETVKELVNPAIVIANYFFDTIPQDLFRIHEGVLQEGRISLFVDDESLIVEDVSIIEHLKAQYTYVPIVDVDKYYIQTSGLNAVLAEYIEHFNDMTFLFPLGAFQAIRYFQNLTKGKLLLLGGDQGVVTGEQVQSWGEPRIDKHGTFSIPVSYHAIATYVRQQGGFPLMTSFPDPIFVVMSAVFGGTEHDFRETTLAFEQSLNSFEPKDYWKMATLEEKDLESMELDSLILILKFGGWDPINFVTFFESIRAKLLNAPLEKQEAFSDVIDRIFENYYPVSKSEGNFILNLGVLSFDIGEYRKALTFFEKALEVMGPSALVYRNISACYAKMSCPHEAFQFLSKANKM